jgi:hypothetical protein
MLTDMIDTVTKTLFGYDFFISYAHFDGKVYAAALEQALKDIDCVAFRDEAEHGQGSLLDAWLKFSIRRSSAVIVIATEAALESSHVQREVANAISWRKQMLPIDAMQVRSRVRWKGFEHERVWIEDPLAGSPCPPHPAAIVVTQLAEKLQHERKNRWTRTLIGFAIIAVFASAVFASWQWRAARQQEHIAEQQREEADRQRNKAQEQTRTAQMRLAETLHQRELSESEENNRWTAGFLLAAEASAASPDGDPNRDLYRLRTLYLSLWQPESVHQLGIPIKWIFMPNGAHWISFSKLPFVDIWNTRSMSRVGHWNVDPEHKGFTDISPFVALHEGTFELVVHDPEAASWTEGMGFNIYQEWSVTTGKFHALDREIGNETWPYRALPSRSGVSIGEFQELRKNKPQLSAVLQTLAGQPRTQKYFDKPPNEDSPANWWIDAISPLGDFLLATFYPGTGDIGRTWNANWLDWNSDHVAKTPGEDYTVALWEWDGQVYHQGSVLRPPDSPGFVAAGFGRDDNRTLLWLLQEDNTVDLVDPKTDQWLRPPIHMEGRLWAQISNHRLVTVESNGRVGLWPLSMNRPDDNSGASLDRSKLDRLRSMAFGVVYSPSQKRNASIENDQLAVWEQGNLEEQLVRKIHVDRETLNLTENNACYSQDIHTYYGDGPPHVQFATSKVQFRGDNEIIWCEDQRVTNWKDIPKNQGSTRIPATPSWTVKRATVSGPLQVWSSGRHLNSEETFLGFAADGESFLTWNQFDRTVVLRSTSSGQALGGVVADNLDFPELIKRLFVRATAWHANSGHLIGQWPSGATMEVAGSSISFTHGATRWNIRDPRTIPSAEHRGAGLILALSHSGRILATTRGNDVRLWDAATGAPISPWLSQCSVGAVWFSDDGWLWVFSDKEGFCRWPADTSDLDTSLWIDGMAEPISGMRLSPATDLLPIPEVDLQTARSQFQEEFAIVERQHATELAKWFRRHDF